MLLLPDRLAVHFVLLVTFLGLAASQEARQPLATADAAMQAGRFAEAATQYEQWLKTHPASPQVLLALGVCYLQMGRPAEAVKTLEQHVKLAPRSAAGHAALGLALLDGAEPSRAKQALERAVQLDPRHTDARLALARLALAEGQPAAAVEAIAPACRTHDLTCLQRAAQPLTDDSLTLFGEALARAGRAGEALALLQQRVGANPSAGPEVYVTATRTAIAAKDLPAAAAIAEQGMRRYPDSDIPDAYLALPAEMLAQRVAARVNALNAARDVNEMVTLARVLMDADPYRKTRAHDLARQILQDALAIEPNNPSVRYQQGRLLRLSNDPQGAIRAWEAGLGASPADELKLLLYSRIGVAKADLGDLPGAEEAQRAAYEINRRLRRHRPEAALEYAALLRALDRPQEAEKVIQQVLAWSPLFPLAYLERAKLAAARRQWSQVAADSEFVVRAAGFDTDSERTARTLLVRAYHNLGQAEKAKVHSAWLESNR